MAIELSLKWLNEHGGELLACDIGLLLIFQCSIGSLAFFCVTGSFEFVLRAVFLPNLKKCCPKKSKL